MSNQSEETNINSTDSIFNSEGMIEIFKGILKSLQKKDKNQKFPLFTEAEVHLLSCWIFRKPKDEYALLFVKKEDEVEIIRFLGEKEAAKHGIPYRGSSRYLRRMKFIKEYINNGFNAAAAARKCGYSYKYAKQEGYRLRRNLFR